MKDSLEQIQMAQILYEISMSIGVSLDLRKMLKVSILTFLKKLNCAAGGVHILNKDAYGQFNFEKVHSTPRNTNRNVTYQAALKHVPAVLNDKSVTDFYSSLPLSGQSEVGDYFYIFELPDFGLMILINNEEPLAPSLFKSLAPLLTKLTAAAHACVNEQALQELLERRASQVQISIQIGQEIATAPALDELFQRVVNLAQERLGYYHVHAYILENEILVMQEGTGESGRKMKETEFSIPLTAEKSLVARAARTGEAILAPDVSQEPGWLPNPLLPGTHSELAVPIKLGDEVLGVLDVQNDIVGGLDEEDQLLLLGLCGQIAVALQNTRLFAEQQQTSFLLSERVKELNCLNDIGQEIAQTPPLPEFLQWAAERISPAMQHPHLCRVAIKYGDQVYGRPEAIEMPVQIVHALRVGNEVVGRIYISYTEKRDFMNRESMLLGGIANRISSYIESYRLLRQIRQQAERERLVNTISQKIQDTTTVENALQTAIQELGQAFRSRYTWVELTAGEETGQNKTGIV